MKSISEPIARRANAEDKVDGRFWHCRLKCQLLKDKPALLAAMTYVDLNPIRASIALAMVRANSFNAALLTNADYLELVDFTGRMISRQARQS